jgi:hypothetical protein
MDHILRQITQVLQVDTYLQVTKLKFCLLWISIQWWALVNRGMTHFGFISVETSRLVVRTI